MFVVPYCDLHNDFRVRTMISSLFIANRWRMCSISYYFRNSLALTTADSRPPSWNRITDRTHAPPFGKRGEWKPLNVGLSKAKGPMYYCSSNEHIMESKLSKHLSNNYMKTNQKKILHCRISSKI